MKTQVVGTQFKEALADGISQGSELKIVHEKDNKFDKDALAVIFKEECIGYIGKNSDIYDLNRIKFPMNAKVVDFYFKEEDDKFKKHKVGTLVSCTLEIEEQIKLSNEDNVKSFNEDVIINFNEKHHIYTNPLNGNILKGATTYIKKYIKPFSSHALPNCVKYWKLDKEIIQGAWDLSGDLARIFGTGIHKALEFEDLYASYKKPKDGSRCFRIKHPAINKIVSEFYDLNDSLGFIGDVIPEALITDVENDHCALADRVLVTSWENKTCRLQDYKVNHGFLDTGECNWNEVMPLNLPTTKLSKLAMQLKFQAQMLEKNGWTVEGCDGFVYAENWEHYKVDMLDGFDIIKGTMN